MAVQKEHQRLRFVMSEPRPVSGILSSTPGMSNRWNAIAERSDCLPVSGTSPGVLDSISDYNVTTRRPPAIDEIPWYHFNISRHVAESLLISTGEDGSYLLRDSGANPGEFTLSVRSKDAVKHFPVRWDGQYFVFGFGKFSNVYELISHFESKPVIGGDSGILTILKYPYPRSVEEPEVYDSIRVHAEGGSPEQKEIPTFAIASKEGYLTKLGKHRKSWKTRWFVLYKNELSYFKTREDKEPIRVINIREVSSVAADNSQLRENCFKVVTSSRTFFLVACSAQDAEDWIKILKWKLDHPSGIEAVSS